MWVKPSPENAERVIGALSRFGAPLHQLEEGDFAEPDLVFQIGIAPRRIDLLTSITGVAAFFDEARREQLELHIEGLTVPVLGRRHLIQNKRATGRPQDIADVVWL